MPLTNEQLRSLPELPLYLDRILAEDDPVQGLRKGTTIRERVVPKFIYDKEHAGTKGDDIVMFMDEHGERWFVEYHLEGGPYKRRAPF